MKNSIAQRIIIFTTPTCSYCNLAKRYFREKKVRFKEIDISKNASAAADVQKRTGQTGVPVILVNNRPIVGFDKEKLNRMLGLK